MVGERSKQKRRSGARTRSSSVDEDTPERRTINTAVVKSMMGAFREACMKDLTAKIDSGNEDLIQRLTKIIDERSVCSRRK